MPRRWGRPVAAGLALALSAVALLVGLARFNAYSSRGLAGGDYRLMVELGRRWLAHGTMYLPYQYRPWSFDVGAGTNNVAIQPSLYPPPAGPFFALATPVALLWWGVPLALTVWVVIHHHPRPWTWPAMAAILAVPLTTDPLITGNPNLWIMAAVAAGTVWGWPALLVLLKPTFAPFALIGLRARRASLIAILVLAAVNLAMLPEWLRYVEVLRGMSSPGLTYSLGSYPLLAVPLIAWAGRQGIRAHDVT